MGHAKFIARLRSTGDKQDKVAIESLRDVNVTSKESYLWNFLVIRNELNLLLDDVAVELFNQDTRIEKDEFEKYLRAAMNGMFSDNLSAYKRISSDDVEVVSFTIQGMLRIFDKHSHSVFGLIQSCRVFAAWAGKVRYDWAVDDRIYDLARDIDIAVYQKTIDFIISKDSAISNISLEENQWIDEFALKKIRGLYRVFHIVVEKSTLEGRNRITRRLQKIFGLYP